MRSNSLWYLYMNERKTYICMLRLYQLIPPHVLQTKNFSMQKQKSTENSKREIQISEMCYSKYNEYIKQ